MKIQIESVQNGWILTSEEEWEDGTPHKVKQVFSYDECNSYDEDRKDKLESLEKLYWEINEQIGELHSKHKKYNINIEVEETNKE